MRSILLLALLISGEAQADAYVGAHYAKVGLPVADPQAIELKWGVQSNEIYSFELRAGKSVSADTANIRGIDIEYEAEYIGALTRMGAFNERGGVYAMVGMMDMTIKLSTDTAKDTHSENDLVFGLGAEFTANGLVVEYLNGTRGLEEISWLSIGFFRRY